MAPNYHKMQKVSKVGVIDLQTNNQMGPNQFMKKLKVYCYSNLNACMNLFSQGKVWSLSFSIVQSKPSQSLRFTRNIGVVDDDKNALVGRCEEKRASCCGFYCFLI